jgi:hypothetical protein
MPKVVTYDHTNTKLSQIRKGKYEGERDYKRMIKGKGNLKNTIKA